MQIDKNLLSGTLPFLVLSLLNEGDKYGYELIEELRDKSSDTIALKSGTLYPLLHTLELQNYVTSYEKTSDNNKTRKYYHLTKEGRMHLMLKSKEWDKFINAINVIVKGSEIVYE